MLVFLLLDEFFDVGEGLESDEWAEAFVFLLEHVGVFEVVFELSGALDARVPDLADLD